MISLYGSLAVIIVLMTIHLTIGRWQLLQRHAHGAWLSVSAGAALAYVFVHLLPKLALNQEKFVGVPVSEAFGFLRHHMYLVALAGLVATYWMESETARATHSEHANQGMPARALALLIVGYGLYFLLLGYVVADVPRPELPAYLLIGAVLTLHVGGMTHGLRMEHPRSYDGLLRWVYAAATLLGWIIGTATRLPETTTLVWSSFTAGGITITAIREELQPHTHARFLPFLLGVAVTTAAILALHEMQSS